MGETKRMGKQTVRLSSPPVILGWHSIAGKKEGQGPLKASFGQLFEDTTLGEKTWEKAEAAMQKLALAGALEKAKVNQSDVGYMLGGDLLNQCISSGYGLRGFDIPFLGLYGACSTMCESLSLAALLLDGGYAEVTAAVTSSHFCSAERQYRTPLEYGSVRTPTAQWTVTGAGATVLGKTGSGPVITHITTGKIVDKGIKDVNNMGAAMAPAAYSTISAHFQDTGFKPSEYDLIVTGDLGKLGKDILLDFFKRDGMDLAGRYDDCGCMIYDIDAQDVHCGGSGCGCCASVLNGYLLGEMQKRNIKNLLVCATGALLSPTSIQQGESIPCICHAVAIRRGF